MKGIKTHLVLLSVLFGGLCSCSTANKALKSTDVDYKFETGKQYFMRGKYENASLLLNDAIVAMKGTERGSDALFLLGMCHFYRADWVATNETMRKYYQNYPVGAHVQEAYFYSGKALYNSTPEPRLDQTDTYLAIAEFQNFLELHPDSRYAPKARELVFDLQEKLIEKEYLSAKLYYDLGNYFGNCTMGGSNYQACVVTAQNALKDYPYSKRKEDFAILVLRAKYELARQSIESKRKARYEDTIDEYYGFSNEYPESKYSREAKQIFDKSKQEIN